MRLVVVHKVDRLTRSLADFAKIVDVFDAQGISCVSVTQQFNTATSMGRVILGRETGGQAITRGNLYRLLGNRIYRGEIAHKGVCRLGGARGDH